MTGVRGGLGVRSVVAVLSSILLAGCFVVLNGQGGQRNPIDPALLGPVVDDPGGGPPTECRGVPEPQCVEGAANVLSGPLGVPRGEVERVVVSCVGVCNVREGEYRIDLVLVDRSTRELGGGGYATSGPLP